jgi:arylformamidase
VEVIDVSVAIRAGMPVWPGDPAVELTRAAAIARGDPANVTHVALGAHTGTHVDAPVHFIEDAKGVETLPLDALVGPAVVVDATALEHDLDAAAIDGLRIPPETERLLLKTRNSELWERDGFSDEFVALTGGGARRVVALGIRLVGIDYLSIGDEEAHRALLEAGVVPLEGLDLRGVEAGEYRLAALPLKLAGADGAPARAVLIRE